MPTVQATELKSADLSGDQLRMTFGTRYVGDLDVVLPAPSVSGLLTALAPLDVTPPSKSGKPDNELTISIPKTWLVTKDARKQAVILIFNHQAETRCGFALSPDSINKLIEALSKNAAALAKQEVLPTSAARTA